MDSHDDNQYKLLIDTVNNNRSDKNYSSSSLTAISECSLYPLTFLPTNNSRLENHGSSRRKCSTLFKGITIEEFLEADDDPYQLTAIDKLILKNKAALAEDQMKKARSGGTSKSTKEAAAPSSQSISAAGNRKQSTTNGTKKGVKKVLGSKLANKRKNNSDTKKAAVSNKCNGVAKANSGGGKTKAAAAVTANKESKKSKPATAPGPLKKENTKSRNSVEDVGAKEKPQSQSQQQLQRSQPQQSPQRSQPQQSPQRSQPQQQPQRSQPQQLPQRSQPQPQRSQQQPQRPQPQAQQKPPQQLQRSQGQKQPKKQQGTPKQQQQQCKKGSSEGRRSLQSSRRDIRSKLKPNSKQSMATKKNKSLELGRLKTSLNCQTRSGNSKERLRNGKSRIFQESETPSTPSKSMKRKRCDDLVRDDPVLAAIAAAVAMQASPMNPLKRIKQESVDVAEREVVCEKRRRLSEIKVEANNNDDAVLADAPPTVVSAVEEATIEQVKAKPLECVPVAAEVVPVVTVVPEKAVVTVKEEILEENLIKEEFSEDFIQEDGADLIDIDFITNLLSSTDCKVSSCLKPKASSSENVKCETVCQQSDGLTERSTLQNGDIRKEVECSNANVGTTPIHSLLLAPQCPSEREFVAEVPSTNSFLSEVNNRLNHDSVAKESMFNALGLQSINKVYPNPKECEVKDKENYTGTLKAIIKVDKGCRRMEMKPKDCISPSLENSIKESFPMAASVPSAEKCNTSTMSSDGTDNSIDDMEPLCIEDPASKNLKNKVPLLTSIRDAEPIDKEGNPLIESIKDKNKIVEPLVVPEKSSSFSIHPDRLCSDVCKYCFGKFGSLDTPCHVAQLKNEERQRKILLCEPNLKLDTCLCDACFRYVDRKANRPPKRKTMRGNSINQRTMCAVQNCNQVARHYGKRKWRLRMGKKIPNLCVDVTKSGSRVSFGLCSQHFCMVESFPSCGICKKRTKRKEMTSIRTEVNELNGILSSDGIPVKLAESALLCKYCHNCVALRRKYGDFCNMSPNNRQYYLNFRNEILRLNNVPNGVGNGDELTSAFEKKKAEAAAGATSQDSSGASFVGDTSRLKGAHNVDIQEIASLLKPLDVDLSNDKNSTHIQLKFGNLNIGKLSNLNIGQNTQPPPPPPPAPKAAEPKPSPTKSAPAAGEKELPLMADFKFGPESGTHSWEKCVSTILFDKSTKKLWQDLQQPYGNQSSFVRHLIMLEKFWRVGALVLAENAEPSAVKYINSVKNRVESLGSTAPPAKAAPVTSSSSCGSSSSNAFVASPAVTTLRANFAPSPVKVAPTPASVAPPKPEPSIRHASTPPPLLKLGTYPMPMMARSCGGGKPPPVMASAVRNLPGNISLVAVKSAAASTASTHSPSPPPLTSMPPRLTSMPPPPPPPPLQHHQQLPPPPHLEKINNRYAVNRMGLTLNQFKEMMDSQIRRYPPHKRFPVKPFNVRSPVAAAPSVPVQKKASVYPSTVNGNPAMRSSAVTVNFPTKQYASPPTKRPAEPVSISPASTAPPAMLIAKLPKALTVTQISETVGSHRRSDSQPSAMAAPFLVGEKPSVSVFREITKN